jgi:hypothetical protein
MPKSSKDWKAPGPVVFLYICAAFFCIVCFRFFFPDSLFSDVSYLEIFRLKARLAGGVAFFISIFPAIFMSALVIPVAFTSTYKRGSARFSESFFDSMKKPLSVCVVGTIVFGLLSLVVYPLLTGYQAQVRSQSKLYAASRIKAEEYALEENWRTAAHFMNICEGIWKENPALAALKFNIANGLETLRYARAPQDESRRRGGAAETPRQAPLSAQEALEFADRALGGERYYDANWFADTASKLSAPGSVERARAARISSLSWNAIEKIEPNRVETRRHSLYKRKREGYEALVSGDAINAYYIFKVLQEEIPEDPDVQTYFDLSRQGLEAIAFFYDEFDLIAENAQSDAIFSLPDDDSGGRLVLRMASFASFENCAFGRELELIAVDAGRQPAFAVNAELVKIVPIVANGRNGTAILMRPVDRNDPDTEGRPQWTIYSGGGEAGKTLLFINLPYEDFVLAANAKRSTQGFFSSELWSAAAKLKPLGFIPQIFYAQMIRRFYLPAFFLPLSIFALIIAWKYRPKAKPRHTLIPMLFVLPLVFESLILLLMHIFNLLSIWTVVTVGWFAACLICAAATVALLFLSLFLLAAQRGGGD